MECDILIIGAGPAGCSVARSATEQGAKTIIIDKKKEKGIPIQCAEGIGKYLIPYLPFKIPRKQLRWKIEGMSFWTDNISTQIREEWWKGYTINRDDFDKWLLDSAIDKGVNYWSNSELIDLKLDKDNFVKKAIIEKDEKIREVIPKIIIAADGAKSTVLRLLNLYHPKPGDIAEVYSWEMRNMDLKYPHLEQIYLGDFSPSGYAYIFPKSKTSANLGIGHIHPDNNMIDHFEEFLNLDPIKNQVKNAEFVIEKSGMATIGNITNHWIYQNVILVGDAANHNLKPFVEGILPSIICGYITGEFAVAHISKNKMNENIFRQKIFDKLDPHLTDSQNLIYILQNIYSMKDKRKHLLFYGLVTEILNPDDLVEIQQLDYSEIKEMIKNVPQEIK